jgi:DNA-binding response OmpR family regulator
MILRQLLGLTGIGAHPDSPVKVLSGGERQGLAIGRAMYFGADIVILDIRMPDLNGVEVLKEMRRLKGDDFGVIILSGHAHTDIALDAMRAGANDFLLKPCSVDELLERIDMLNDRLAERRRA